MKKGFGLYLIFFMLLFLISNQILIASNSIPQTEYYPLAVGNKWTFESEWTDRDGKQNKSTYSALIAVKNDSEKDKIHYYLDNGRELMIATKDGIITDRGYFLLQYPVKVGKYWISGKSNIESRITRIESDNEVVDVKGRKYKGCLKVSATTDLLSLSYGQYFWQSVYYLAKGIGPVLIESYEIDKMNKSKLLAGRHLLISRPDSPCHL